MVHSIFIGWVIGILVFFVWFWMVRYENRRGNRLFLVGLRGRFDRVLDRISGWMKKRTVHFSKYIVQLHWYYGIHSFLKTCLRVIVAVYSYFENAFERNRKRAKQLRVEKRRLNQHSHLGQVSQHKEQTALSEKEKESLRQRKLEGE